MSDIAIIHKIIIAITTKKGAAEATLSSLAFAKATAGSPPCSNMGLRSCRKRFRSQLSGGPIGTDDFSAALIIVEALGFQVRKTRLTFNA